MCSGQHQPGPGDEVGVPRRGEQPGGHDDPRHAAGARRHQDRGLGRLPHQEPRAAARDPGHVPDTSPLRRGGERLHRSCHGRGGQVWRHALIYLVSVLTIVIVMSHEVERSKFNSPAFIHLEVDAFSRYGLSHHLNYDANMFANSLEFYVIKQLETELEED